MGIQIYARIKIMCIVCGKSSTAVCSSTSVGEHAGFICVSGGRSAEGTLLQKLGRRDGGCGRRRGDDGDHGAPGRG